MAVAVQTDTGRTTAGDQYTREARERIEAAKRDRKRFEPNWLHNLAFASGKHWLKWSRTQRRLVLPKLADGRERYTIDELTQYRYTALGEMSEDDDRPELLFRQSDVSAEDFAKQANDALGYWWDNEGDADRILAELKLTLVDLGTAAVRVWFDPSAGPVRHNVPHQNGKPILDPQAAHEYVAQQQMQGAQAQFKDIHEGRIRLLLGSPFNLLVPPGIEHDRDFPWECWVRPVLLSKVKEEYGAVAQDLVAEDDIAAIDALGTKELSDLRASGDIANMADTPGKLEDHIRLYIYFERPCKGYPEGQVLHLGGKDLTLLRTDNKLPDVKPDGTPCSGITYFHFQKVTGRFWARSLVDPGKDPQRLINKRRSQIAEIIDRGLPKIFAEEGSVGEMSGDPVEYVPMKQGTPLPQVFAGVSPGAWMQADVEALREDLARSVGIRDVSLGENPQGVGNYSQLALLKENDIKKLGPIIRAFKTGVKSVVEDVVYDIRRYWGSDKQVALAGEDGWLNAYQFNASQIPAFYQIEIPTGATLPRSQAAKLKMIEEIYQAAINAQQPLPVAWLKDSYEAGEPLPLPEPPNDIQHEKAELENQSLGEGKQIPVAEYDPIEIHLPIHRELQVQAEMSGNAQVAALVAAHIQQHELMAQQAAMQQAAAVGGMPGMPPGAPGQPPSGQPSPQPGPPQQPQQNGPAASPLAAALAGLAH